MYHHVSSCIIMYHHVSSDWLIIIHKKWNCGCIHAYLILRYTQINMYIWIYIYIYYLWSKKIEVIYLILCHISNLQVFKTSFDSLIHPSIRAINQTGSAGQQGDSTTRRGIGLSNLPAFFTAQNQGQPFGFHRQRAGIHPASPASRLQ